MTIANIQVEQTLATAEKLLAEEKGLSPALKAVVTLLIQLLAILCHKKTSANSSVPPSEDKNRKRGSNRTSSGKKAGGQKGHKGAQLEPVENPDEIITHTITNCAHCKKNLKKQPVLKTESRQEFEVDIKVRVIEHQAEVKECSGCGKQSRALFPEGITRPAQYGSYVKALMVYLSQYQLIPYERLVELFGNFSLYLSAGTISNTIQQAYSKLEEFEIWAKSKLKESKIIHTDETGFYINKTRYWLHCQTNTEVTLLYPHLKRGFEGIMANGVLADYGGYLCHDGWPAYYKLEDCFHINCHSHILRDLILTQELKPELVWPIKFKEYLKEVHEEVQSSGGSINKEKVLSKSEKLKEILINAQKETPDAIIEKETKKRGRPKKSKERNLLERILYHEASLIRYLEDPEVPFTNNIAERDIRMTKVQQKISGCFRSWEGAQAYCRIRSYLITARKNGQSSLEALQMLFKGERPHWMC